LSIVAVLVENKANKKLNVGEANAVAIATSPAAPENCFTCNGKAKRKGLGSHLAVA
jgi:hypothetical protein